MPEMVIDSIRVSLMNYQRVVILKEKESDRYLPIWIGPAEADAIAVKLQDVSVPRPLTHDLLRSVIKDLGAGLTHITVCDLQNDTFYAKISLQIDGRTLEVDSRPSDAIALAVRREYFVIDPDGEKHEFWNIEEAKNYAGQLRSHYKSADYNPEVQSMPPIPIYVADEVLDKAGIVLDESGKPLVPKEAEGEKKPPEVKEEELRRMSAFTEFINTLDLEDLGKGSQQGS